METFGVADCNTWRIHAMGSQNDHSEKDLLNYECCGGYKLALCFTSSAAVRGGRFLLENIFAPLCRSYCKKKILSLDKTREDDT